MCALGDFFAFASFVFGLPLVLVLEEEVVDEGDEDGSFAFVGKEVWTVKFG